MHKTVDVAIIGAGTSGLNVLSQVRKAGKSFVLIDGGELGTTCARVGCMPSKALIQIGDDFHRRKAFGRHAIEGQDALRLDTGEALEHVRDLRDIFVDRVLESSTDDMGEEFIAGHAEFVDPQTFSVNGETLQANRIVIATGTHPVVPEAWQAFGDRILTTDTLFELEDLPQSMAVIGLGVIGLELGQALSRYGVAVTGIDQLGAIAGLTDPVASAAASELLGKEFPIWLGQPAAIEAIDDGLRVSAGEHSVTVDKVLVSMGRTPNIQRLGLDKLGIETDRLGVPAFDPQTMQVGDLPIFIAGDTTGERPILHEAADEGKIAGYNAAHDTIRRFRRKVPLAITFCDPNIAMVGQSWAELQAREDVMVGEMRFGPVGRALIMAKNKGVLRLYAEQAGGRLLGAAMVAPRGEHLAHLLAWSIQQGLGVYDLLKMPYYHPTLEEGLQAALQDLAERLDGPSEPLKGFSALD